MNIFIEKSKFVDIEGLSEAAIASSDAQLLVVVNYAELAASHSSEASLYRDDSMHPIHQLREACFEELCRRHGDDYILPALSQSTVNDVSTHLKAVA